MKEISSFRTNCTKDDAVVPSEGGNIRHHNTGNDNTGWWNTGNYNTGDYNAGWWNTGDHNAGNSNIGWWNTGDGNTGNYNAGNDNTGHSNTGHYNTGNCNAGDHNTGDWNKSSFNSGCFNTIEQKIMLFNKPSDMTYDDWCKSGAKYLLDQLQKNAVKWIDSEDMTDEEKKQHPEYKTIGGCFKALDKSEYAQRWWDALSDEDKGIIRSLPNFDADIFKQCTGITVEVGAIKRKWRV